MTDRAEICAWAELAGRLAAWRQAAPRDDIEVRGRFGVGLTTLRRIECGEVEPSEELGATILREIEADMAPVPGFALRRGPHGHEVAMAFKGAMHHFSLAVASAIHAELGDLLAISADPRKFER